MLGCLEVIEYSLKERFNIKKNHQVSYLRLQDEIGVSIILLSIRYSMIPVLVQYITTSLLLLSTWYIFNHSCVCRGYVIIERVSL